MHCLTFLKFKNDIRCCDNETLYLWQIKGSNDAKRYILLAVTRKYNRLKLLDLPLVYTYSLFTSG